MSEKGKIKHLNDSDFAAQVKHGVTLVDFYADWCGPCRMLAPVLEQVAKEVEGQALIAKVDVDKAQQIASKFEITSIPTMILFKDGEEVNRIVGLKNSDAIKELILSVC